MTAASRRGVRAEERAAAGLGTQRVHRQRGERAPDLVPVRTAAGVLLGPEVKSRAKLPRLITSALEQAASYFRGRAIPVAVVFERGRPGGILRIGLDDFARLVGLDVAALPPPRPMRRKAAPTQLDLFGSAR